MRTSSAVGAGRTRARDPDATRRLILAAAQAMMAEQGPSGLTVSDVARRARVNRGTAYQHFPTRESLVAEVLDRLAHRTKAILDAEAPASLDARIDATVEYFVRDPELVRLSLFRMLAGIPHPSESLWREYVERVGRLASSPDSQPGIDAEMAAIVLLGATVLWSLRVQSGGARAADTERYLRELKRFMLHGMVRPERHPDLVATLARSAGATPDGGGARPRAGKKTEKAGRSTGRGGTAR